MELKQEWICDLTRGILQRLVPQKERYRIRLALAHAGVLDERAVRLGLRKVYESDTFLVSFPKSGNTWLRFLTANMLHPDEQFDMTNINDIVPDIYRGTGTINDMSPPMYIKSHDSRFNLFPRFVYIVRDVRDVLVSFYHYSCGNGWFKGTLSEYVKRYHREGTDWGYWSDHVTRALEVRRRDPSRSLMIRYEDLIVSPAEVMKNLAIFYGLSASGGLLEQAIEKSSFENLRGAEDARMEKENAEPGYRFFRKGVSGDWEKSLSEPDLERIYAVDGEMLRKMGYMQISD
jgi:hypothetical protein